MNLTPYIGLQFQSKGREASGVDCWGLVQLFYRQVLGLEVPSYAEGYHTSQDRQTVSETIIHNVQYWKKVQELEFGDVLVFQIKGLPLHTGVYIGNNDFLHAFVNTNSCIERLNSINWERRLLGAYRWIKI